MVREEIGCETCKRQEMESGCRLSADDAVPSTCTPDEASSLSVLPIEEAIHASRTEGGESHGRAGRMTSAGKGSLADRNLHSISESADVDVC